MCMFNRTSKATAHMVFVYVNDFMISEFSILGQLFILFICVLSFHNFRAFKSLHFNVIVHRSLFFFLYQRFLLDDKIDSNTIVCISIVQRMEFSRMILVFMMWWNCHFSSIQRNSQIFFWIFNAQMNYTAIISIVLILYHINSFSFAWDCFVIHIHLYAFSFQFFQGTKKTIHFQCQLFLFIEFTVNFSTPNIFIVFFFSFGRI